MPKEVIYPDVPAKAGTDPLHPEVGWQPQCWVQLRIKPSSEAEASESGLSVDLTRPQINKLIRVLKRARDQAYGKDE